MAYGISIFISRRMGRSNFMEVLTAFSVSSFGGYWVDDIIRFEAD